jgi:hypothetical protein
LLSKRSVVFLCRSFVSRRVAELQCFRRIAMTTFTCRQLALSAVASAWLLAPAMSAPMNPTRAHRTQASAFCDLISFTEWPEAAFVSAESPLVVGILGHGEIPSLLEEFLADDTWRGRPVTLRRVASINEVRSCHVLYVSPSALERWRTFSRQLAGLPILTASDVDNFAREGGMVQFTTQSDKVRLIVNLRVARACGITISSKVLRLADVIDDHVP